MVKNKVPLTAKEKTTFTECIRTADTPTLNNVVEVLRVNCPFSLSYEDGKDILSIIVNQLNRSAYELSIKLLKDENITTSNA